MKLKKLLFLLLPLFSLIGCNDDDDWNNSPPVINKQSSGIYILNEGEYGQNNSTLDFWDFNTGKYTLSFFTQINPQQAGLGDTGNDIAAYGNRLYIVVNASNYVEVINLKTGEHIGKIEGIANGRNITFHNQYAYITSYAGPMVGTKQLGYVYRIDTANIKNTEDKVVVGYQPEGLTIANNKLYVANSGGYLTNYDNRVSIIDLDSFKEIKKIEVATNLSKVKKDKNNVIWITSLGNYKTIPGSISAIDPSTDTVIKTINIPVSNFDFYGNELYYYSVDWSTNQPKSTYGKINIITKEKISGSFISEADKNKIVSPYGLIINKENGDIFIGDASNYVNPGKIFWFDKNGNLKNSQTTGVMPAHFEFLK